MQLRDPELISADAAGLNGAQPTSVVAGDLPGCPVIALSDDPLLLEALTGATQSGIPVSASPSPDRFIDQLVANGAGVALIDATCVSGPLKPFLVGLREQFPQLLLMLTGPAQLQAQFSAQIEDGTIFRFVHKPASSQRLRLFLDAASRQLTAESPLPEMRATRIVRDRPPIGPRKRRGVGRAVLAALLLAAGAAAWVMWQRSMPGSPASSEPDSRPAEPPAVVARSEPAALATISSEQAAELAAREAAARDQAARGAAALEQAQRSAQGARADQVNVYLQLVRKRLASGALIEPADDSARSYLASAQALAPEDADVRALSLALGEAMISRFRHALVAGDIDDAQHWLQACGDYRIGSATLTELTNQLQLAQASHRASPGTPNTAAAPSAATTPSAATAPSAASAPSTASSPSAAAPTTDVAPAARATAIAPSPTAPAIPSAASVSPASTSSTTAAAVTAPVVSAAVVTAAAATAPAAAALPATSGSLPAPAGSAGPSAIVNESSLTRVVFVRPSYPEDALEHGVAGWVDLDFTVTAEGKVSDITVTAAEPSGVFERAARTALARNRYRPVFRDGVAVAQRTRIRVRFQQ